MQSLQVILLMMKGKISKNLQANNQYCHCIMKIFVLEGQYIRLYILIPQRLHQIYQISEIELAITLNYSTLWKK